MFHVSLSTARSVVLSALLAGCVASPDADPLDDIDSCGTCSFGAADVAFSVEEGSYEALAILELVNAASFETLDDEVPLHRTAAQNIVDGRGAEGFATLEALDAVPYVGPAAMRALARYVEANGLVGWCGDGVLQVGREACDPGARPTCLDTCAGESGDDGLADDPRLADYELVHGVRDRSYLAGGILRVANELSEARLDRDVPLEARAAANIARTRGRGLPSLLRLDEVPYVGPAAFAALAEFAVAQGYVASCGDGVVYAPLESCDDGNLADGDFCSARCDLESVCGDALREGPYEACDDGNAERGDGCDERCGFETLLHRDAPTEVGSYLRLRGYRDPNGVRTEDWRLDLAEPASVRLVYGQSLSGQAVCVSSEGTTQVARFFLDGQVLQESGAEVATFETFGVLGAEDELVVELPAGRYLIRVPAEHVCPPGYDGDGVPYSIALELTR